MSTQKLMRINIPGGIVSTGALRKLANTLHYMGKDFISLGTRQDIYIELQDKEVSEFNNRLQDLPYTTECGSHEFKNLISSLPSKNIQNSTHWLSEGVYLEIISAIDFKTGYKINLVDPAQSLVPFFSGNFNFIASDIDQYWYLFIRYENSSEIQAFPMLVDSFEIAKLCRKMENLLKSRELNMQELLLQVTEQDKWNFKAFPKPFQVPNYRFPPYEGFQKGLDGKYWLGLFEERNRYSVAFLDALCLLCTQLSIPNLFITNWNSLVVKNIEEQHLEEWDHLLGTYNFITRHAAHELNWKIPDNDKAALGLKNYLVKALGIKHLRTEGIVFGITNKQKFSNATFIIEQQQSSGPGRWLGIKRYKVKHKREFNINSPDEITVSDNIKKRDLPEMLLYLTEQYYHTVHTTAAQEVSAEPSKEILPSNDAETIDLFQCRFCYTVYDPQTGDEEAGVVAGLPFDQIPSNYRCPLCEADKSSFISVKLTDLQSA